MEVIISGIAGPVINAKGRAITKKDKKASREDWVFTIRFNNFLVLEFQHIALSWNKKL